MPERRFIESSTEPAHLKYLWNDEEANRLKGDPVGLLRYRSNLLGADLRITNFGRGNTSSKIELPDPFTGKPARVLAVKGSGGDLGSIQDSGFALLYRDRLLELKQLYRGEAFEDEMVGHYPLLAFGHNKVAASIDTPLHAFVPFPHVDHLHADWAIAIAASANGKRKLGEFNARYGRHCLATLAAGRGSNLDCSWSRRLQRFRDAMEFCWGATVCSPGEIRSGNAI